MSDRLQRDAARTFVGRSDECALFRKAIASEQPPFVLLRVVGPGGIGKSTLLREFRAMAEGAGIPSGLFDGRQIEPAPHSFETAACEALGFHPHRPPDLTGRFVLLVDTFESLAPLSQWLMREFLPAMPARALLVVATRAIAAQPCFAAEPGWEGLVRTLKLRNFDPVESRMFLDLRGVAPDRQEPILRMSYGHPLAIAIAADTLEETGAFGESERAEIIGTLLDRLIGNTPTPEHRMALEMAAHARVTTEAMLADAIGTEAESLFGWLRRLSFIEIGHEGLSPHDLARDIIHSDLAWRNPARLHDIHLRTRRHHLKRYQEGTKTERLRALRDLVYLHRLNPIMRAFFEFRAIGQVYAEPATEADYPGILALIERHEGARSASIARHWLARQPQSLVAMRSADEKLVGVLCHLDLRAVDADDAAVDPVVREARKLLEASAPRPGETATLDRYFVAAASYQSPSPAATAIQIQTYLYWMTTPRLSWSFLAVDRDTPWDDLMRYIDFAQVGSEITDVPPRRFRLFGHDWRRVDVASWFAMMEHREIETRLQPADLTSPGAETVVLSEAQFRQQVREALRHYSEDAALMRNPLLRSRLLMVGNEPARPEALREKIIVAAQALKERPKDEKFFSALDLTFLHPAPSQEAAAERLGVPFGTYRYRLNMATERVADALWQQELGTPD